MDWNSFSDIRKKSSDEGINAPSFRVRAKSIPVERTSTQDRRIEFQDLSPDQIKAHDAIVDLAASQSFVSLGGYAGTGKTSLAGLIAASLEEISTTAFVTFTGKASNVLDRKLRAAGIREPGFVGTIHRLIYKPITDPNGKIIQWIRNPELSTGDQPISRIIIDEASMVSQTILEDLQSFGVPIIAIGDPGQLPPIKDRSVVEQPDFTLEQIHRQAANNPIIQLAHEIRTNGDIPPKFPESENVQFCSRNDAFSIIGEAYERLGLNFGILVRRNAIRKNFNTAPRVHKEPVSGDIVICLKNNPPIYNGMRGILDEVRPFQKHYYYAKIRFPDDGLVIEGPINKYQFGREYTIETTRDVRMPPGSEMGLLFDYGLALTVHKSQGSAFDEALLIPERWSRDDPQDYCRWLYTAVTRASDKITITR